jgi:hypothetical protein
MLKHSHHQFIFFFREKLVWPKVEWSYITSMVEAQSLQYRKCNYGNDHANEVVDIHIWMQWSTKTAGIISNCTFCSEINTDKMLGQVIPVNLLQLAPSVTPHMWSVVHPVSSGRGTISDMSSRGSLAGSSSDHSSPPPFHLHPSFTPLPQPQVPQRRT